MNDGEGRVMTDEQLAECVPATATILVPEAGSERKKVCMTRAELQEFAQAIHSRSLPARAQAVAYLNDMGTSQKLSFAPMPGAFEHHALILATRPVSGGYWTRRNWTCTSGWGPWCQCSESEANQVTSSRAWETCFIDHSVSSAALHNILAELVACKDLKEQAELVAGMFVLVPGSEPQQQVADMTAKVRAMEAEYKRRQPAAWAAARAVLALKQADSVAAHA